MKIRLLAVIAWIGLLAGCGGFSGGLAHFDSGPPVSVTENDEFMGEELNARRLEELYAKSGIPGGDTGLNEELSKWDHQIKFDVPIQMNKQVKAYLVYFSTDRKAVVRRWLARSTRYLPMIKETFREYGLPEDLAYLAMIESGFNPNAGSPAGAIGMWQFIRGTGLRYGLVIDGSVDERRDPVKSTHAAARYLKDLYQQFGSWYLAAASYNCGEGRVQKELRKSNHRNFWELSSNRCLPSETKNYVPQLIAATIIAKNPEKFGFTGVPYQSPGSPEVQLAQASMAPMPIRRTNRAAASRPLPPPPTAKASAYPESRKKLGPQTAAAPKAGRGSGTRGKNPGKQPAQVAQAKTGKRHSTPYVASLFGYPQASPKNHKVQQPKSPSRSRAYAQKQKSSHRLVARSQDKKPARLAKKAKTRQAQAKMRPKNSTSGKNGKLAKKKPKALLVSKAW